MAILREGIDEYLETIIPDRDTVFQEMEEYAEKHGFPIVGPQVGQILMQYAKLTNAKRIFELGSGYGYSALWFARASDDETQIYCTDTDSDNASLAKSYFERANVDHRIEFLVGDAVEMLQRTEGKFDIIYCDINKEGYPDAYDKAIPRLKRGGLLLTDNTLWSGRILDKNPDQSTKGILAYNHKAFSDDRVLSMILPIRDGVCVSLKK